MVMLSGSSDRMTEWGAILYLAARTLYLPLYVAGIAAVRTAIWSISFIGLALMFIGVLV